MDTALATDLCRSSLALSYPEEVDEVDGALARLSGHTDQGPPVAMGVSRLPLADYLLAALMFLTGAAAGRLAERGVDALTDRVRALFADRRRGQPARPFSPQDERDVVIVPERLLADGATREETERVGRALIIVLRDTPPE